MSTTAEATREELLAEYVARDAIETVLNNVYGTLFGEDDDVLERFPSDGSDQFVLDHRLGELFEQLFPEEDDCECAEYKRASAESSFMAARILRAAVYHADYLRKSAQHLFQVADKERRELELHDDA